MSWTSVKDSLPEEWQDVLVWGHTVSNSSTKEDADGLHLAHYYMNEDDDGKPEPVWSRSDSDGWHMSVTHWQPKIEGPGSAEAVASIKTALKGVA